MPTVTLLAAALLWIAPGDGGKEDVPKMGSSLLGSLSLRCIGPAFMSGRIADIAVDPEHPSTWYVAAGSGNLWKTLNAGTTWTPIFESQGSYSLGCVTLDPRDSSTVWVGTGEAVGGRHVGFGDGVYVSRDAGRSFQNVGLQGTEHIAKILVDPRDSRVVFVAAQGPLWSPGGERGLYRSADGGATWQLVLSAGPYTGVTDVVMEPGNPDVLYAATHQRHRTVWALLNGGPESGVHKSVDGGRTWRPLRSGLPGSDKGKIALAVSPQRPEVVYASLELPGREGGLWRSEDRGESWQKQSDFVPGGTGPHYYQEIWLDPHRFDVIYQADVRLARSEDGGRNWERVETDAKHVDNHAVAFHPTDPDFLVAGCDGGLYRSFDRGATWDFVGNLPLTQFYKIALDDDWPVYHVVGGTQDNNTQYGPARTLTENGIRNSDWRITLGGDGYDCAIEPGNPDVIYGESQNGYLRRFDRRTGETVDIRPQPGKGETEFRFNWDAPLLISPHSPTRLYFGSQHVHRSDDRGDSWTTLGPDLSRGRERYALEIMGRVWSVDATWDLFAMSQYANVTAIAESPLQEGLLYAGTDDGLIQASEDGGRNWRRIERIYGIPEYAFVNDVEADLHDADTVYAALDNHKEGDFTPYLLKSTDRGRSWQSIRGDLPDRHLVWRILQDHEQPELLFAGTEFGIFVTVDGGEHWISLPGLPRIPFRDVEIQRRENDLVGGSFGRGIYVLDDYSPLRALDDDFLGANAFHLFPVRKALLYLQDDVLGGEKGSQGDAYYTAANPEYGAVFTYYLKETRRTLKDQRQEKEREIAKAGGDVSPPDWDALREEEREEEPTLLFEVRDGSGTLVNRVTGPARSGLHRISWNLRYSGFSSRPGRPGRGPLVVPGTYSVRAFERTAQGTAALGEAVRFEVEAVGDPALPRGDRGATLAFQMELGEVQRSVLAARGVLQEAQAELTEMQGVIREHRQTDLALLDEARALELRLRDAMEALTGDTVRPAHAVLTPPSILDRIQSALFGTFSSTHGPTATQRRQVEIAREEYGALLDGLRQLVEVDLEALERKLDEAGAPWTPGRRIPALPATE